VNFVSLYLSLYDTANYDIAVVAKGGSAAAESTTTTPWVRFVDESSQCTYYFNAVTGETTWEEPPEGFLTDESALEWHRQSPALPETTRY